MTSSSQYGNPPLRAAIIADSLPDVRTLLTEWRQSLSPSPLTPLHLHSSLSAAISAGHPAIVAYLLDEGADLSPSSITLAIGGRGRTVEMFEVFLGHGWDINGNTDMRAPALKNIITDEPLTRWFLSHGADPRRVGTPNAANTILDTAASSSTPPILDLLITHGALLSNSQALHAAASDTESTPGRIEMMAHLLVLGMDINAIEKKSSQPEGRGYGRGTPLHSAVFSGVAERVRWLCEKGADVEKVNSLGETALGFAGRIWGEGEEGREVVGVLREYGGFR